MVFQSISEIAHIDILENERRRKEFNETIKILNDGRNKKLLDWLK